VRISGPYGVNTKSAIHSTAFEDWFDFQVTQLVPDMNVSLAVHVSGKWVLRIDVPSLQSLSSSAPIEILEEAISEAD
jgi:hypothetical protein